MTNITIHIAARRNEMNRERENKLQGKIPLVLYVIENKNDLSEMRNTRCL